MNMKRFAAWLLSAAMVLTALPVQSFAAPQAETKTPVVEVVEEETTDTNIIQLDENTAFELEPNVVLAEALMENADADTVDMNDPEVKVFMEELDDILVKETTVNDDGTTAVAASKLSEEDKQMLVYMYSFYLTQKQNNADVLGVQVPFYLTYNDDVDGMGAFGELLVLAGWKIEDVRAGKYSVDDILGLILNFYYGDYFAVNDGKNDAGQNGDGDQLMVAISQNPEAAKTPGGYLREAMVAARDGAMKAVEDAKCKTLAQKYYVLNEYVCGHDVMDMAYIMNKGTAASMNAKSPKYYDNTNQDMPQKPNSGVEVATGITQNQYATIFATFYGFYKNMIAQEFRSQFLDPIKQDTRQGVYDDAYWGMIDQYYGEDMAKQVATDKADQFLALCNQIGGIPQMDEQGNPIDEQGNPIPIDEQGNLIMDANVAPQLMFTWDDLLDQAMDKNIDAAPFNGATPNQAVAAYADEAACGLVNGVFSYWTGGLIGAMTQSKSVCLGYTGALSFYVQCLDANYYTTNGDYTKAKNWKAPKDLYYTNGKIDPKKGYTADHVRVVFDADVSMFGEVQPNFSSEHYWNAVKIGSSWYYIDACYIDVYNEVMKRSQVPATGAMNHVYYLISDKTYRDMYTGNYSELYDMYKDLSQDTKYEESWFVRNVTQAVAHDGYFYYTYNSSDLVGTWQLMKKMKQNDNNMDMDNMTKMMEAMSSDYKIVRHSVSAEDLVKETDEDGDVKYGADTNFDTLIDFAYKANEDSDDTYAVVYTPGSKNPVKNDTLTQAYADFKEMEKIYPACSISSTVYNNKVYFSVANAIFTYDLSNGNVQCVKQYPSTVYATRDESVKLGGEALRLANSGDYSVTNAPIAGIYLEDDNTLTVSIGTTYGYICGRETMVDKTSIGYAWKESNYNKDYNSFSGDDDLFGDTSQYQQQSDQESTPENDNDEFMFSAVIADSLNMSSLSSTTYSKVSCSHKFLLLREKTYTKDDDIEEDGKDEKATGENYGVVSAWVCTKCGKHIDATYVTEEEQADWSSQMGQYGDQMGDFGDMMSYMSQSNDELIKYVDGNTIYSISGGSWDGNVYTFSKLTASTNDVPNGFDFSQDKSKVTNITLDKPVACVATPHNITGTCETGLTYDLVAEGYTSEGFHFSVTKSTGNKLEAGQHIFSDTHADDETDTDYAAAWTWDNGKATLNQSNLKCMKCGKTVAEAVTAGSTTADEGATDYETVKISNAKAVAGDVKNGSSAVGTTTCTQSQTTYKVVDGTVTAEKTTTTVTHDHTYATEGTVKTPATCTEDGVMSYPCTVEGCTATKEEAIPATGHTEGEPVVVKATCTEDGSSTVSCTVCNKELSTEAIKATGHTYGDPVVVDPTCTTAGSSTKTCSVCNHEDVTVLDATGHKYEDGSNVCSVCGTVKEHEHTFATTGDVKEAATCTEAGVMTCKCTVEGCKETKEVAIEALGHTEGAPVVTATCTEAGTSTVSCTVCKEVISTENVEALGHNFDEETGKCKRDGCEATNTETENNNPVRASETSDPEPITLGIVTGSVNCTYSDPSGHNWSVKYDGADAWGKDAAYAIATLTCSKCNDKELRVYYPDITGTTEPTCTTYGTQSYKCKKTVPSGKWGTKATKTYTGTYTDEQYTQPTGHTQYVVFEWDEVKQSIPNGSDWAPTATLKVMCATCGGVVQSQTVPGYKYAEQEAPMVDGKVPACYSQPVIFAADYEQGSKHPKKSMTVMIAATQDHASTHYDQITKLDNITYDQDICDACGQAAKETPLGVTVTFTYGSKSTTQFIPAGSEATKLEANTFKKTGYHFNKWSVEEGSVASAAASYKNKADIAKLVGSVDDYKTHEVRTLNLKAAFTANKFKVQFKKGADSATGSMSSLTVTYNKSKNLTANKFKRTGYNFTGWYATRKSGSTTYYYGKNKDGKTGWYTKSKLASKTKIKNKAEVKKLTSVNNATVTLTAQWAKNNYTFVYSKNGGTGKMDKQKVAYGKTTALKSNKFKKTGYKFTGWKVSIKSASGKTTYYFGKNKKGTLGFYKKSEIKSYKIVSNKAKANTITKYVAKKNTSKAVNVALSAQWKKK